MDIDGVLDKGRTELQRDLQPLIDDLKARWKAKIEKVNAERQQVSQELVQNDITIGRLEEDIKALTLTLSTSGSLDPVTSLRHETETLRSHLDNINRDIAACNKQLQER